VKTTRSAQNAQPDAAALTPAVNGDADAAKTMTIREVARHFGVTLRALRFYERKRLLTPRRDGTIRRYDARDCERLKIILRGRRLGFTLAEIAELIATRESEAGSFGLTRGQCVEQIKLLERRKREIEAAVLELRQIYTSFYLDRIDNTSL
jgi:DNA-binding transcriptional MerR regulator